MPSKLPKTAIITCGVLEEEFAFYAREMPHIILQRNLPQCLHNQPDRLRAELQAEINQIEDETDAEAIVLGYGFCRRGTEGIRSSRCRIVIARALDCITYLLGGRERYAEYVRRYPGTWWYSPGWLKYDLPPGKERYEEQLREYTARCGEEQAQTALEAEQAWLHSHNRASWVDLGVGDIKEGYRYTGRCARWLGWSCDRQHGDPVLLIDLLAGRWDDERFLVLHPGESFRYCGAERIFEKVL